MEILNNVGLLTDLRVERRGVLLKESPRG